MFQQLEHLFNRLRKHNHFRYGVPFFGFVTIGWFVLKQTQSVKYEFSNRAALLSREDLIAAGVPLPQRASTLEEIYEDIQKLDINNWENKRGPRMWEETESTL